MTKLDFFILQTGRLDQGGRVTGWLVTLSNRLLRLLRPPANGGSVHCTGAVDGFLQSGQELHKELIKK